CRTSPASENLTQGPCRASVRRYHYDNATSTCKEFTYGGCEGNSNNYETFEECRASCNPATEYEAKCLARPEVGPCRAHSVAWAYNATLGECKSFIYGGCDGNENKYGTKEKCEAACKHLSEAPLNPVCYLPRERGPCLANEPRFYYNNKTERCDQFVYGGCQGNANNFHTLTECSITCKPTNPVCYEPKKVGPCKAYVPRYFYNTTTKFCERFIYGGCQENGNNFPELDVCLKTCKVGYENVTERLLKQQTLHLPYLSQLAHSVSLVSTCFSCISTTLSALKPSACYLPTEKGLCFGYFPRYYYNTTTNACEEFIYGGCRGNANNFKTLERCESKCG
ncbi:hypothetical protein MTO96_044439, partial [Rhipicephalus appendiculatus]